MDIQKNPVNSKGEKTTPVVWEQGCLEEVCGSKGENLVLSYDIDGKIVCYDKLIQQGFYYEE